MTVKELHRILEQKIALGQGDEEVGRSAGPGIVRGNNAMTPVRVMVKYNYGFYQVCDPDDPEAFWMHIFGGTR